jgi:hypothetical protein
MNHSPSYYADLATNAEAREAWEEAAQHWKDARAVSLGHNRRARYEEAETRCRAKAKANTSTK